MLDIQYKNHQTNETENLSNAHFITVQQQHSKFLNTSTVKYQDTSVIGITECQMSQNKNKNQNKNNVMSKLKYLHGLFI